MARIGEQSPLERRQGVQNQMDQDRFKRNLFRKGVREARRRGDIAGAIKFLEDAEARGIAAGPGINSQGLNQGNLRAQAEDAIQNQGVEAEGEAKAAQQIRRDLGRAGNAGVGGQELRAGALLPDGGASPGVAPPVTLNVPQGVGQAAHLPSVGSVAKEREIFDRNLRIQEAYNKNEEIKTEANLATLLNKVRAEEERKKKRNLFSGGAAGNSAGGRTPTHSF